MKRLSACALTLLIAASFIPARASDANASPKTRDDAAAFVRLREELIGPADRVWSYAETALREKKSAEALADYAERQGFRVERGVAGLPTAVVAQYGQGRPIIGLLGEYDALPGLSQKVRPTREALTPGGAGHGCGHNLLGAAALGAAIAVEEQMAAGRLKGTVRFYGCPAEETLVGKLYMARAGVFDDLDVALTWHPGDRTAADTEGTRAQVDLRVDFRGRAAHAASNPWAGRSALDALELFTHGLNLMREHVKPSVRMHYVVTNGGQGAEHRARLRPALVLGPRLAAGRSGGSPGPAAQGRRGGGPDGRGRGQADGPGQRARDARQRGRRAALAGEH
jgi:aminobenzoyl-glutamate utilization protein B